MPSGARLSIDFEEAFFLGEGRLDFELKLGGELPLRGVDALTGAP
jgi:hypothetical protein